MGDEWLPLVPDTCPKCRHAYHASIGFCPNMASDNDCSCTYGKNPDENS